MGAHCAIFNFSVCLKFFIIKNQGGKKWIFLTWRAVCKSNLCCAQWCLTLCSPLDRSPPGSSVHGIFQTRILAGVAIPSCRGPSHPREGTPVSCISCTGRRVLYHCAPGKPTVTYTEKSPSFISELYSSSLKLLYIQYFGSHDTLRVRNCELWCFPDKTSR